MSKLMSKGWMSDFCQLIQNKVAYLLSRWMGRFKRRQTTNNFHPPPIPYLRGSPYTNRFIIKWRIQFEIVLGDPRKYVILKCNQSKQSAAAVVFPPSISATNLQKTYQDLRILHLRHIQHETSFTTRTATLSIQCQYTNTLFYNTKPTHLYSSAL